MRLLLCGMSLAAVLAGTQQSHFTTVRQSAAGTTQYMVALPHLAFGVSWKTSILVRNEGQTDASVTLVYFDDNGNPLSVPLAGGNATQTVVTVPSHGLRVIETNAVSADQAGWAALVYESSGIKAQGVFLWKSSTQSSTPSEAVAPIVSQVAECIIPLPSLGGASMPFDNTGDAFSGYGFANTSSTATTMQIQAFDEAGTLLGQHSMNLPGFGHTSFLLADQNRLPQTAGKRGMLLITGGVAPLGFKFIQGGARFTTWQP